MIVAISIFFAFMKAPASQASSSDTTEVRIARIHAEFTRSWDRILKNRDCVLEESTLLTGLILGEFGIRPPHWWRVALAKNISARWKHIHERMSLTWPTKHDRTEASALSVSWETGNLVVRDPESDEIVLRLKNAAARDLGLVDGTAFSHAAAKANENEIWLFQVAFGHPGIVLSFDLGSRKLRREAEFRAWGPGSRSPPRRSSEDFGRTRRRLLLRLRCVALGDIH